MSCDVYPIYMCIEYMRILYQWIEPTVWPRVLDGVCCGQVVVTIPTLVILFLATKVVFH